MKATPLNSPLSLFFPPHPTSNSSRNIIGSTLKTYLGSNCFLPPPLLLARSWLSVFLVWIISVLPSHPWKSPCFLTVPHYSLFSIRQPVWSFRDVHHSSAQTLAVTPHIISVSHGPCCASKGLAASGHPTPTAFISLTSFISLFFLLFTLAPSSQSGCLAVPQTLGTVCLRALVPAASSAWEQLNSDAWLVHLFMFLIKFSFLMRSTETTPLNTGSYLPHFNIA